MSLKIRKTESWFPCGESLRDYFSVELKHWDLDFSPRTDMDGRTVQQKWNIYVYVRRNHPMHGQLVLDKPYYDQEAVTDIPFHGGCTYFEPDLDGDIKIGCDYSHWGDDRFHELEKPDAELLNDLQQVYDHMINYRVTPSAISEGTDNTGDSNGTED